MSEMIERVASAMSAADGYISFTSLSRSGREKYTERARIAISAMREPTEAMKNASEETHWDYSCHTCGGLQEGWYAMIDEALK